MNKLLCTVGLPRSGKTTWATKFAHDHSIPIVNPDAIRLALHGHRFIAEAEQFVWAIAKLMVASLFGAGHRYVIVDATNITVKHRDVWKDSRWETLFVPITTPCDICLERAKYDTEILPVIRRMASEYQPPIDGENFVEPLGATGEFPDGTYFLDDEGELKIAVATDKKASLVRVEFGKRIGWLSLDRNTAHQFAESIRMHASLLT